MRRLAPLLIGILLGLSWPLSPAVAEEPQRSCEAWFDHFNERWDETAWMKKSRGFPDGYMRPMDDEGWKVRLRTLQGLLAHGREAVPLLLETLKSGDDPQRILAAQALGYLAPHVPHEPLLRAARHDENPAVRLYAVDSLGMQGDAAEVADWQKLQDAESNRDVRKHIGYAMERGNEPLDPKIMQRLLEWNADRIDIAEVGKPAPDFELESATGETIRLRDYRGKKNVVLVFIYGDT